MKSYPAPPIPEELVSRFRQMVEGGTPQHETIAEMRLAGLHKIHSIKLISLFYGISIGDAKRAVHLSDTWSDRRASDDAFHDSCFEAAKQLGFEEVTEPVREEVAR